VFVCVFGGAVCSVVYKYTGVTPVCSYTVRFLFNFDNTATVWEWGENTVACTTGVNIPWNATFRVSWTIKSGVVQVSNWVMPSICGAPSPTGMANCQNVDQAAWSWTPGCSTPSTSDFVGTWVNDDGQCLTIAAGAASNQLTFAGSSWWVPQSLAKSTYDAFPATATSNTGCVLTMAPTTGAEYSSSTYTLACTVGSTTSSYLGAFFYNLQGRSPGSSLGQGGYGASFFVQQVCALSLSLSLFRILCERACVCVYVCHSPLSRR
jgi:hypothetical protein